MLGINGLNALRLALKSQYSDIAIYLTSTHPSLLEATSASEAGNLTPLSFLISTLSNKKLSDGNTDVFNLKDLLAWERQ